MKTHRIANIVVASTNSQLTDDFAEKLGKDKYHVASLQPKDLEEKTATFHPDLICIDVSCDDFDGYQAIENLKNNPQTEFIPIVALAAEKSTEIYERAIESRADDIFIHTFDIQEFYNHIGPLLRLSTMFSELEGRLTMAKGIQADIQNDIDLQSERPYRILLIAPKPGDKANIETVLEGHCDIEICDDIFRIEDLLSYDTYDALICNLENDRIESILSLAARIRNNPRLFNLPLLVLSENDLQDRMEAYRRGVTRIVSRPLNQASLRAKIKMLVRRQRLRWAVKRIMDTTHTKQTQDEETQAYAKEFFDKNLKRQIENAHKWKKHLTVICITISNFKDIEEKFNSDAANTLLLQVQQWISNLTRVEDLIGRTGENEFCISLPDTPVEEAQIVMHRIAGILSYTDFAVEDIFQPLSVWVETGLASLGTDDNMESLLKRAHEKME